MFSALSSRRVSLAFAGIALVSMTAACGGSTNSAICTDAAWTKAFTEYTTAATASAGDLGKFNDATAKLSADLKALAGTADGDVATALNDFATSFGEIKIDPNDPAAAGTALSGVGTKISEATTKLVTACS
ncbi:hypothetical protein [Streptosporangium subroseum]|uniref:hypothetical protein n=1 Tax=Streptosporangium subroseum TaxID=106412 RepID=UPI0030876916|nr:hypothetical protein OHB15_09000 [Streptosporangium subroseum]